jgi:hypothetical protein
LKNIDQPARRRQAGLAGIRLAKSTVGPFSNAAGAPPTVPPPRGARPRLANVILETGTVKPDATKKPMALDFTILERDDAGKLQLGIVEMADDTATFALAPPGSTVRPTEFVSGGAAGVCLAKKVK